MKSFKQGSDAVRFGRFQKVWTTEREEEIGSKVVG